MSVRGGLVAAAGAGLVLTLGGGAATAAPSAVPQVRQLGSQDIFVTPREICNLYQTPNNTRASICSAASYPTNGTTDGYYRGTFAEAFLDHWVEVRVPGGKYATITEPDFRGVWTGQASVQFRVCDSISCGPWK